MQLVYRSPRPHATFAAWMEVARNTPTTSVRNMPQQPPPRDQDGDAGAAEAQPRGVAALSVLIKPQKTDARQQKKREPNDDLCRVALSRFAELNAACFVVAADQIGPPLRIAAK